MVTKFSGKFAIIMLKKHRKFCRFGLTHLDATPNFKNCPNTYALPCRVDSLVKSQWSRKYPKHFQLGSLRFLWKWKWQNKRWHQKKSYNRESLSNRLFSKRKRWRWLNFRGSVWCFILVPSSTKMFEISSHYSKSKRVFCKSLLVHKDCQQI